jgi:hypothetical protein
MGYSDFQSKIIVSDENLHHYLKQKEGQYIVDNPTVLEKIIEVSPFRFFSSKYASIIVKQKISTMNDTVDGPHTHLLPNIILKGIDFPIPINDDHSPQIQVDPFGGVVDGNGNYNEWAGFEIDDFQKLLMAYGSKNICEEKKYTKKIIKGFLEKEDFQSIVELYSDTKKQDLIRIILSQLVCDKTYNKELRRRGILILERSKAINFQVLKNWALKISPEIIDL